MATMPYWMKRRDLVQQMLQLGIQTDLTSADLIASSPPSKIHIDCIGGVSETSAFDLNPGGTGYMLSLRLTVLRKPFAIAAFDLELPWTRTPVIWLSDPADGDGPHNTYRFPGRHSPEFPRDVVINHRANPQRNLSPGRCIEGLLLGYGLDRFQIVFNTAVTPSEELASLINLAKSTQRKSAFGSIAAQRSLPINGTGHSENPSFCATLVALRHEANRTRTASICDSLSGSETCRTRSRGRSMYSPKIA